MNNPETIKRSFQAIAILHEKLAKALSAFDPNERQNYINSNGFKEYNEYAHRFDDLLREESKEFCELVELGSTFMIEIWQTISEMAAIHIGNKELDDDANEGMD